jgi:hypothetical protein
MERHRLVECRCDIERAGSALRRLVLPRPHRQRSQPEQLICFIAVESKGMYHKTEKLSGALPRWWRCHMAV